MSPAAEVGAYPDKLASAPVSAIPQRHFGQQLASPMPISAVPFSSVPSSSVPSSSVPSSTWREQLDGYHSDSYRGSTYDADGYRTESFGGDVYSVGARHAEPYANEPYESPGYPDAQGEEYVPHAMWDTSLGPRARFAR
jgi:hypothetical protein